MVCRYQEEMLQRVMELHAIARQDEIFPIITIKMELILPEFRAINRNQIRMRRIR
jgi:hypothetical protein